jgi:hypothetical protein
MEEAGEEEKGRGAPGLGTSSKLLEPGVKGTWGGGMASPTIMAFWEGGGSWLKLKNPKELPNLL